MRSPSAPRSAKAPTARQLRRSRLQQQPGLGLPADVVSETMIDMQARGVRVSVIAELFRTTPKAVRQVLERHRQRLAPASKPAPIGG